MKCEVCQRSIATIHLQEAVNGVHRSLHLCNACATAQTIGEGVLKDFTLSDILTSLTGLAGDAASEDSPPLPELECTRCGLTTAVFQQSGLLGCPACYEAFAPILAELVPALQAGSEHAGKTPGRPAPPLPPAAPGREARRFQIDLLGRELDEAVAAELYERAAELRDEIRQLRVLAGDGS